VLGLLGQRPFFGKAPGRHSAVLSCGGFQPAAILLCQRSGCLLLPEDIFTEIINATTTRVKKKIVQQGKLTMTCFPRQTTSHLFRAAVHSPDFGSTSGVPSKGCGTTCTGQ
jgi:hypothetical protein